MFSVLTFLRFMTCLMSVKKNMCKEKMFQLKSISDVIKLIDSSQELECILSDLNIQISN